MSTLLVLTPISLLLLGIAIAAFVWAVKRGQYDDLDTPAALAGVDAYAADALRMGGHDEHGPGRMRDAVDALLGVDLDAAARAST